jgi:hypothetical protein
VHVTPLIYWGEKPMAYIPSDTIDDEAVLTQPVMRFRAVIAGWLVATAVAGLLYVAGLALGFASFDAWNASGSAKGIGIGTGVWMVVTWIAALFGWYVCSVV